MKQYERYKESRVEWLGRVPEHWEVRKLKTFCDFVNRGTTPDYQNSGYKVVNQATFSKGFFDESDIRYTSLKSTDTRGYLKKGDVLLASTGGGVLGKSFLFQEEGEYIADSHVTILRDLKERFVPSFLMRFLSIHFDLFNGILAQGSTNQIELQREWLRDMQFPYPSIQEQNEIATYLDNANTKIDKAISQKERVIELLNERRQIIIQRAVTRGLDPNVPMKDSGVDWIGEIPEHWEVKRIKNIGMCRNGLTYSPNDICSDREGTLVLRSSNISKSKLILTDNVYVKSKIPNDLLVKKGDILICSRNGSANLVGKLAVIDNSLKATFGAFMMIFRSSYPSNYISYILEVTMKRYMGEFSTSTINQLTLSIFSKMFVPFINDLNEQQQIATYLDNVNAKIDKAIALKRQEIEKLKEYKTVLIDAAVTGKIKIA